MESQELTDPSALSQDIDGNQAGLEVINIPLTRLLAQHGITLQATPGISDLQNGSILTINGVETLPQTSDVESALTNGTTEIVFSSTGSVENQVTTADGLPIVGNQMLCVPNMSQTLTFVTDYGIANSNMVQGEDYNTISLQYKIQPFEHFVDRKVFSHVVAFLSDDVAAEMFTNHSEYMDFIDKEGVFQMTRQEGNCTIAGELWALLILQKRLQVLMKTGRKQSSDFFKPEFCNKLVQTEKPKTQDMSVQTNYPIKKEGSVNCGTMCEILLPSVTAFGREIKQSGRLNTNASSFLSHSVDDDLDEEYTPRSRRKRKPKRSSAFYDNDYKSKTDNDKSAQTVVVVQNNKGMLTIRSCSEIPKSTIINQHDIKDDTKQVMNAIQNDSGDHTLEDTAMTETGSMVSKQEEQYDMTKPTEIHVNEQSSIRTSENMVSVVSDRNHDGCTLIDGRNSNSVDSNFIQSDVNKASSGADDMMGLTSASDFTPVTSEDSMENDISGGQNYNTEENNSERTSRQNFSTGLNSEGSVLGNSGFVNGEDQIQAALRASHITFEDVPEVQTNKPRLNVKKKSKKDYESLTPFKFFCDKCSFKSKRQSHLKKHMKFHETVRKMYYCKQCNFKTIRNGALRRHELTHSSNLMHCNQCKYTTDDFISLDRHMKLKHDMNASQKKKKTVYKCPKCDYSSMMPSRYAAHLRLHKDLTGTTGQEILLALQQFEEKEEPQAYQCNLCSYKSIRKEHLVRHRNNVHTDHRPFLCDTCGQAFKRRDALSQHKITHVDKMNRNYAFHCGVCKKSFRSKTHLNEHMAMHSSVRQFLCDICGTSFKTKSCQQKHIKSIHHNPRSFECSTCRKRFNTKFALLRHYRTHEKAANIVATPPPPQHPPPAVVTQLDSIPSQIFTLDSQPGTLVQDIITTEGEVFETTEDNLQQVLLKTNDTSESATAIMYLPTSLQFN